MLVTPSSLALVNDDFFNDFDEVEYILNINETYISVIKKDNKTFIPLKSIADQLNYQKKEKDNIVVFTRLAPYEKITIDLKVCIIESQCLSREGVVFIDNQYFSENFKEKVEIDLYSQVAIINKIQNSRASIENSYYNIEAPYKIATAPVINLKLSYFQGWGAYSKIYADVIFHQVSIRDNRSFERGIGSTYINFSKWFDNEYLTYYELGDVDNQEQKLISNSSSKSGFFIEKTNGISDNSQSIVGYADPFSQVELYDESILLAFQYTDALGRYEFSNVHIGQGARTFFINKEVNSSMTIEELTFNLNGRQKEKGEFGYSFYIDNDLKYIYGDFNYNFLQNNSLEMGFFSDKESKIENMQFSYSVLYNNFSGRAQFSSDKYNNHAYWLDYSFDINNLSLVGESYNLEEDYNTNWNGFYGARKYVSTSLHFITPSFNSLRRVKLNHKWFQKNNGKKNEKISLDGGLKIGKTYVSLSATKQEKFTGELGVSGFWNRTHLTAKTNFEENQGLTSATFKAKHDFISKYSMSVNYFQSIVNSNYSIGVNVNYIADNFQIGAGYNYNNDEGIFTLTLGTTFSLSRDPLITSNPNSLTLMNVYSQHDETPPVHLDTLLINSARHTISLNELKEKHTVHGRPRYDYIIIDSHPGSEVDVTIPFSTTCTLEGYIKGNFDANQLSLVSKDGYKKTNSYIFDDGYYYVEALEKGDYTAVMKTNNHDEVFLDDIDLNECTNDNKFLTKDLVPKISL